MELYEIEDILVELRDEEPELPLLLEELDEDELLLELEELDEEEEDELELHSKS